MLNDIDFLTFFTVWVKFIHRRTSTGKYLISVCAKQVQKKNSISKYKNFELCEN